MSTNNNPIVSVIVPARNEEACLGRCLESLVAQTGIKFEIIVADDASTDRTAEIARSFLTFSASTGGKGTSFSRATEDSSSHERDDLPANHAAVSEQTKSASFGTAESRALSQLGDPTSSCPSTGKPEAHIPHSIIRVISAPSLPDGWTGKNNAMTAGAKIAKGKWLLFTDADTIHKPGSLAHAVAEAEEHGAGLLSYSPEQEVRTFWEKAVMPVIFAELVATYPPRKVNDPASPIAAANGQYLLISREAYDAAGGHTKIASDLLEDVGMARLVKSSGRKIFFRYGGDAVRTRMYRTWPQMKEGWTKNLALLFKRPVGRAVVLVAWWVFSWIAFGLGLRGILSGYWKTAYYVLPLLFLYGRIYRARFSPTANLFAITCGIPLAAFLFLKSAAQLKGGVVWKGRTYKDRSSYSIIGPVASDAFMEGVEDLPAQERRY